MLKVLLILSYVKIITEVAGNRPNTLLTYSIPEERSIKEALGYIEDSYLNFTELTSKYNYASEEHTVITKDGYILTVFRILPKCNKEKRFPVVLMHGVIDSADGWILSGPQTGLGYILSNNCYDVWAANNRGNRYSRRHIKLNPNQDFKFWDFSFEEVGNYDVTATIDYVLNVTKKSKVYYIGHSQGTTDFLVMTSSLPNYNKKIQLGILLAPVAFLKHARGLIPAIAAQATEFIKFILDSIGLQEIAALNHLEHVLLEKLCQFAPGPICGSILYLGTGYKQDTISARTLTIAFGHLPVGVSAKTLAHFGQMIASKRFQRYDEGSKINKKKYGTKQPPEYNISQVTCPVVLVCGQNDWLSTIEDIDELSAKLPNVIEKYVVPDPSWSHNNHVWGVDAPKYVFDKILQYFKDFDNT